MAKQLAKQYEFHTLLNGELRSLFKANPKIYFELRGQIVDVWSGNEKLFSVPIQNYPAPGDTLTITISAEDRHLALIDKILTGDDMLTTFTITLKADLRDTKQDNGCMYKQLFIYALKELAETLYAQCSVISRKPPLITVTQEDEETGTQEIKLFNSESKE